ncbi:MAG: GntR family transcriptional regulator [Roseiflexaceae bacterium]
MPIQRPAPRITRYGELVAYVRAHIHDQTFPPGTRLPTEMALAHTHHISRSTVRQALHLLEQEGLVERIQGSGTFVRRLSTALPALSKAARRIGVVLTYAGDQLNMELLIGIDQAAKARSYTVSFSYSLDSATQQDRNLAQLREDGMAGLILFPVSIKSESPTIAQLQADGVPIVFIDRYLANNAGYTSDYVVADNVAGGYRATEHLLVMGHTRIGFIYNEGYLSTTSVRDRYEGYRKALRDYGVPDDHQLIFAYPGLYELSDGTAALPFLAGPTRPSAVFVSNDLQALVLYQTVHRCGLRVPEDLAVVSFDDLSFAAYLSPPLTTVAQPRVEIGQRAAEILLDRIEGDTQSPRQMILPTQLVVRDSCGARLRIQQSIGRAAHGEPVI